MESSRSRKANRRKAAANKVTEDSAPDDENEKEASQILETALQRRTRGKGQPSYKLPSLRTKLRNPN